MLTVGDDGVARCPWGDSPSDYRAYHDDEWGRRIRGERELFERLTLEAFQSGLSWLTILRKRANFRVAFADFDPDTVASFDDRDRARLLGDAGIVRNARKIDAAIANARGVVALRADEGFEAFVEGYAPPDHRRPALPAEIVGFSAESTVLAKALKQWGFAHVGPTTCYSMFQACGYLNDHAVGCAAGDEIDAAR